MMCPKCEGKGTCLRILPLIPKGELSVEICPDCLGTGFLPDDFFVVNVEEVKKEETGLIWKDDQEGFIWNEKD